MSPLCVGNSRLFWQAQAPLPGQSSHRPQRQVENSQDQTSLVWKKKPFSAQKWTWVCPWACGQGTPVVVEAPQATSHCGLQPSLQWMGIILWKLGAEETSSSGAEGKGVGGRGGGILPDSTTWKNTWFGMCGKFLEDQLKMRCVNSLLVVVHKPVF